jgi:hypothetical protein
MRGPARVALILGVAVAGVFLLAKAFLARQDARCAAVCEAKGFGTGALEPGSGFIGRVPGAGTGAAEAPRCTCR